MCVCVCARARVWMYYLVAHNDVDALVVEVGLLRRGQEGVVIIYRYIDMHSMCVCVFIENGKVIRCL